MPGALLADAGVPLLAFDAEGILIGWNQAAQELLGEASATPPARSLVDLFVPTEQARVRRAAGAASEGRAERLGGTLARRMDGRPVEVRATFTPTVAAGRIVGIALALEDQRRERRLERELRAAVQRERTRSDELSGLLAALHDAIEGAELPRLAEQLMESEAAGAQDVGRALASLARRLGPFFDAGGSTGRTPTSPLPQAFTLGDELEARLTTTARRGQAFTLDLDEALYEPVLVEGGRVAELLDAIVAQLARVGPAHVRGRVQAAREDHALLRFEVDASAEATLRDGPALEQLARALGGALGGDAVRDGRRIWWLTVPVEPLPRRASTRRPPRARQLEGRSAAVLAPPGPERLALARRLAAWGVRVVLPRSSDEQTGAGVDLVLADPRLLTSTRRTDLEDEGARVLLLGEDLPRPVTRAALANIVETQLLLSAA
ncbi:MAG: PAS domain-containing protein [Myxococcota bacterium]